MEVQELDYVLVPIGLLVLGIYHLWLLYAIIRHPSRTVVGLNAQSRYQWVISIMAKSGATAEGADLSNEKDPLKNGVLAVQTIRNNIMASTLLATTAITVHLLACLRTRTQKPN